MPCNNWFFCLVLQAVPGQLLFSYFPYRSKNGLFWKSPKEFCRVFRWYLGINIREVQDLLTGSYCNIIWNTNWFEMCVLCAETSLNKNLGSQISRDPGLDSHSLILKVVVLLVQVISFSAWENCIFEKHLSIF